MAPPTTSFAAPPTSPPCGTSDPSPTCNLQPPPSRHLRPLPHMQPPTPPSSLSTSAPPPPLAAHSSSLVVQLKSVCPSLKMKPFSKWCRLRPREAEKVPESAWKCIFYSLSWTYCSYLLFFTEYNFFYDPPSAFHGWKSGEDVPRNIALIYLIQGSFYAHSTYATLYMDVWRKDSVVMIVHHVVTFCLIMFSYAFRYHNIGILVLFLHDFNDILLEFTKLNIYFKTRGGAYHKVNSIITDIGSVLFSMSWFWFRLYWFPIKVLYVTCCSSLQSNPNIPFYFFFNVLLFALTLMNIYWFLYIVMFVVKVLTGQVKEVNDVREYDICKDQKIDDQDNTKKPRHKDTINKQSITNGFVKKKRV